MKTSSPNPHQVFSPEVSHTLQALSFIRKSLGITEPPQLPPTKTEVADTVVRPKRRNPDFLYTIDRSFEGLGEIELAIEVTHYRAPGDNKYLDHRDPNYEPGEVEFGDAISVETGKTVELTPLEWDAVDTSFWNG